MLPGSPAHIVTASGPRAAERKLLESLEELRARSTADLAAPVRIVVPSRSLRLHVAARLAAQRGAWAGVTVETLAGLAHGVLARAAAPARSGAAVLATLTRRLAAEEPELASSLGGLADPFAAVVASVRDLLDAGLGAGQAEVALEVLEARGAGDPQSDVLARSRAVVRVAARILEGADAVGVDIASRALARAAEALDRGVSLPARAIIVHGFAEATGVAGDLLEALMRRGGVRAIIDLPADPEGADAGAFAARLLERLGRLAPVGTSTAAAPASELELVEAADAEAEARVVVENIRSLLDGGVAPERIGIVAREVGARLSPLVRHLERLAVPFSGPSLVAPGGSLRVRLGGLLEVLAAGEDATVDRWHELAAGLDASFEIAAALRFLGATRLVDLARIDPPRGGVRLPLASAEPAEGDDGEDVVEPMRVGAGLLRVYRDRARAALELLRGWPESARPSAHALHTAELVQCQAGWPAEALTALHEAVEACAAELAPVGEVTRREWARALGDSTRELCQVAVGGSGGGVQVLGAMEARTRTFQHLFLVGLQRDVFPRRVMEDPLLPDSVRGSLSAVLPDVPIKSRGHLEERYLFAQLAGAAERVVLSWAAGAGAGTSPASPFVEELCAVRGRPETVPRSTLAGTPATAWELAVDRGVAGDRSGWAVELPTALAEGWRRAVGSSPANVERAAAGLVHGRDELERAAGGSGPLLGVVGGDALGVPDALAVTTLEGFARCPWQAFVARTLRVAPMTDPLLALPSADRRLVGVVVHDVLARWAAECGAAREVELHQALGDEAGTLVSADEGWLDHALSEAADEAVRREGVPFPGFAAILALLARPFVVAALDLDARAGVVAAEADGRVAMGGATLRFRADRVDVEDGGLVLTDYKTGRPGWTRLKRPASRRRRLLEAIGRGMLLQAAAYAAAEPATAGRYLYLDPDADDAGLEVRVEHADGEVRAAMANAVAVLLRGWTHGVVVPRTSRVVLRTPKGGGTPRVELAEAPWCRDCRVREACLRDDSGLRGRLETWLAEPVEDTDGVEAAARALWRLGAEPSDDGESGA